MTQALACVTPRGKLPTNAAWPKRLSLTLIVVTQARLLLRRWMRTRLWAYELLACTRTKNSVRFAFSGRKVTRGRTAMTGARTLSVPFQDAETSVRIIGL